MHPTVCLFGWFLFLSNIFPCKYLLQQVRNQVSGFWFPKHQNWNTELSQRLVLGILLLPRVREILWLGMESRGRLQVSSRLPHTSMSSVPAALWLSREDLCTCSLRAAGPGLEAPLLSAGEQRGLQGQQQRLWAAAEAAWAAAASAPCWRPALSFIFFLSLFFCFCCFYLSFFPRKLL